MFSLTLIFYAITFAYQPAFFCKIQCFQTIIQRDAEIEKMVKEVFADSLKSYIKNMVAFVTRNTLSTQTDPKRGMGAARNRVLGKLKEFAK